MRVRRWLIAAVIAGFAAGLNGKPVDLNGAATDAGDGRPVANATVYIYTAGVRTGTSTLCPSCYADCGKTAKSDADGHFHISGVSDELIFRVLVVADGYKPVFVTKVDPLKGEAAAKLTVRPIATVEPARILHGHVLGPEGNPVVGALVSPFGCEAGDQRWWGPTPDIDEMCVTNALGEWALVSKNPAAKFDIEVEARGLAKKKFELLAVGGQGHDLHLGRGATVTGRLAKDGAGVGGVRVGLVQMDRQPEVFTGAAEIGTDAEGRFTFPNVGPEGQYCVYAIMDSLKGAGATVAKKIDVGSDESIVDAGTVTVEPGHIAAGVVELSDGKPIPAGTRVMLGLEPAWDHQIAAVDEQGRFRVTSLPPGLMHLSVSVKGYHLSPSNRSLDPLNLTFLAGQLDADVTDLRIVLDPGEFKFPEKRASDASDRATANNARRIEGAPPKTTPPGQ